MYVKYIQLQYAHIPLLITMFNGSTCYQNVINECNYSQNT